MHVRIEHIVAKMAGTRSPKVFMRGILDEVGVESNIIDRFESQEITPEVVSTLSDGRLLELGLTSPGKRQRLRSLCNQC